VGSSRILRFSTEGVVENDEESNEAL
jgi:hypothetical protein